MSGSSRLSILLLLALIFSVQVSFSQKSKSQLEKEKQENLKRIEEAHSILQETETQKKSTLGQLSAISRQIEAREMLIGSISEEVNLLGSDIDELNQVVKSLDADLKALKQEYASMIYAASKSRHGFDRITFLFSAQTFSQFLRRLSYLSQYAEARKTQAVQIKRVTEALNGQKREFEAKRTEQQKLLASQVAENKSLLALKDKQSSVIKDLSSREKQLKNELALRKQAIDKLDNLIAELIKAELEKERAAKSPVTSPLISSNFEGSKTKLPWPVSSGFVSSRFGRHPHPVLKGVEVDNQGIDIQTGQNEIVKSVFDGTVATVAFVPGMNSVVIIKHGDYYTLYARLKKVNVKKGQEVKIGDIVGEVFTDTDGISEIQFQVWKNNQKLDPEKWLMTKK
ncbi:peptidoglycan DD-metalloendopeptidase family protein [Imperialibacter roseus]|uniref:Peptidoglycan DD-metalloendopeptidase family protein n=1 Tax=Imperialibacter roseus TaxID=1324217 RepID=A0ABZ0ILH1_9BACT|nr:peptidoglycan DD-metalloendopeptidase family protein [Imperialibacter roseus]WOK05536.1 peptidoglycan DD-metalloendopeptidase family protein [Imperialibacter roseus]